MVEIYGIKNCDTMKKALAWLDGQGVAYQFHDFKKEGLEAKLLDGWLAQAGWETLLNRRGTIKDNIDAKSARQVMLETPTIIKRPVLVKDGQVHVGFKADDYQKLFG